MFNRKRIYSVHAMTRIIIVYFCWKFEFYKLTKRILHSFRYISNRYLRTRNAEATSQSVEWGYAFDVHLNAFFPLLIILHVVQLFFIHCNYLYNMLFFISKDGPFRQKTRETFSLI